MATGEIEVDFGAFPGASDASVAVTGQTGIVAGSMIGAWIKPKDTTDHTADEHIVESIEAFAHTIVASTGFTISVRNTSQLNEPLERVMKNRNKAAATVVISETAPDTGGKGTRIYGKWNIGWAWV